MFSEHTDGRAEVHPVQGTGMTVEATTDPYIGCSEDRMSALGQRGPLALRDMIATLHSFRGDAEEDDVPAVGRIIYCDSRIHKAGHWERPEDMSGDLAELRA